MSAHPPRRRQLVPPSAEEQQRRDVEAEAWRAEMARRHAERRPAKIAAIRTGPALRDIDAAADCHCGCHPSAADSDHHDGGRSCPCQQTPEERRQARDKLFSHLAAIGPIFDSDTEDAALAARADELGVSASIQVRAAPFVITGEVDGRGFYLRERHGEYQVTVASDDEPAANPWELSPYEPTLDISAGSEEELTDFDGRFDAATALTVAVDAVRTFLARRTCPHEQPTGAEHRFCSRCGVRLVEADRWRA